MIEIRRADAHDTAELARLRAASLVDQGYLSEAQRAAFAERARADFGRLFAEDRLVAWLLCAGPAVVGTACAIYFERLPFPDGMLHAELSGVYVEPPYRGAGHASRLVGAVVATVRASGARRTLPAPLAGRADALRAPGLRGRRDGRDEPGRLSMPLMDTPSEAGGLQWGGRFASAPDPALLAFGSSLRDDLVLAEFDLRCSRGHVAALESGGVLAAEDAGALRAALDRVAGEIADGSFAAWALKGTFEDVHGAIDARVRDYAGVAGERLHAGRSRNDQVATTLLLYARDRAVRGARMALDVAAQCEDRAAGALERRALLAATTHWQPAQPVLLAFWLDACAQGFVRAAERFARVAASAARFCPLGSAALAGSSLPLDRAAAARELGFAQPSRNALDTVGDRDVALDLLHAAVRAAVTASRPSEELVIWATPAFGYVRLDDAASTGSSLMPQKRNPDPFELVRAAGARAIGRLRRRAGDDQRHRALVPPRPARDQGADHHRHGGRARRARRVPARVRARPLPRGRHQRARRRRLHRRDRPRRRADPGRRHRPRRAPRGRQRRARGGDRGPPAHRRRRARARRARRAGRRPRLGGRQAHRRLDQPSRGRRIDRRHPHGDRDDRDPAGVTATCLAVQADLQS